MVRLAVGGLNRYYICPRCQAIREEVCDRAGLILGVRTYAEPWPELGSEAAREQARAFLQSHAGRQLGLF